MLELNENCIQTLERIHPKYYNYKIEIEDGCVKYDPPNTILQ